MLKRLTSLLMISFTSVSLAQDLPGIAPYTAEYHSEYQLGWFSFDIEATRRLTKLSDDRWSLSFTAEASIASLKEYSEFTFNNDLITPAEYRYRASGMVSDDDRTLLFVQGPGIIKDLESGKTINGEWQDGLQDNMTYMLQGSVELAKGAQSFSIPVFETRRTKKKEFRVVAREKIKVPAGEFEAIRIEQVRKNKDRELSAWFAVAPGYPMIRLSDKKNGKLRYRIEATSLSY